MGTIVTPVKIEGHVATLFKKGFVVLDNNDGERGTVNSMVQRLRDLRKREHLLVAYDVKLKRTVFVLSDDVKVDKRHRYHFGGNLLHYVFTGRD